MIKMYVSLLLMANIALAEPVENWQLTTLDSKNSLRGSAVFQHTLW